MPELRAQIKIKRLNQERQQQQKQQVKVFHSSPYL